MVGGIKRTQNWVECENLHAKLEDWTRLRGRLVRSTAADYEVTTASKMIPPPRTWYFQGPGDIDGNKFRFCRPSALVDLVLSFGILMFYHEVWICPSLTQISFIVALQSAKHAFNSIFRASLQRLPL